jgi:hypothetical protein
MPPSLAIRFLFEPRYVRRVLNLPARNYIISTWQRPAIAMEPLALLNRPYLVHAWTQKTQDFFISSFQIGVPRLPARPPCAQAPSRHRSLRFAN